MLLSAIVFIVIMSHFGFNNIFVIVVSYIPVSFKITKPFNLGFYPVLQTGWKFVLSMFST